MDLGELGRENGGAWRWMGYGGGGRVTGQVCGFSYFTVGCAIHGEKETWRKSVLFWTC